MAYYGRDSDPADYYTQESAFDPFTGRLNAGQLLMKFLNDIQATKDQKQAREWAKEDRELNKRLTEARIVDYTKPTTQEKDIPDYPVAQVTSLASRLNYPQEFIDSIPQMSKSARARAMEKLFDDVKAREEAGKRIPKTAATTKGKNQQSYLSNAAKMVNGWANMYRGALTQLESNPTNAALAPGKVESLRKTILNYETLAGELQTMLADIDENGEIPEDKYARAKSILKNPANIETAPTGMPPARPSKAGVSTPTAAPATHEPAANVQPSGQVEPAPADRTKLVDGKVYKFPNGVVGKYNKKTNSITPVS